MERQFAVGTWYSYDGRRTALNISGGGSEIASVGSSSAISIPVATEGIAIAGTGLAISGSALANMFDVRIQKSESNKGNESGKSTGESGKVDNTLTDAQKSRLNALEKYD